MNFLFVAQIKIFCSLFVFQRMRIIEVSVLSGPPQMKLNLVDKFAVSTDISFLLPCAKRCSFYFSQLMKTSDSPLFSMSYLLFTFDLTNEKDAFVFKFRRGEG